MPLTFHAIPSGHFDSVQSATTPPLSSSNAISSSSVNRSSPVRFSRVSRIQMAVVVLSLVSMMYEYDRRGLGFVSVDEM